ERHLETDSRDRLDTVTERGVEDPPLAEVGDEKERLVLARAPRLPIGIGGREDGHVLRGAAQTVIELVLRMTPARGQASKNRMLRRARIEHELVLSAVASSGPGRLVANDLAVAETHVRAVPLVASAPAAEPDHAVVLVPFREGVVRRVDDDETPTFRDEPLERRARRFAPRRAVVVRDDEIVAMERGPERGAVRAFGSGRDI